jgi:nitrite reductase/ring-hydroxylating ferredoxin subunit
LIRNIETEVFVPTSGYVTSASNVPGAVTLTANTCTHWFAGGLKVIDNKGGGIVKCTIPNGGKCTRNHVAPFRVTKAEAIRWNSTASLKEFKTRIATQIDTFQNFQV